MTLRLIDDMPDRTDFFEYDESSDTVLVHSHHKNVQLTLEANKAIQGKDIGKTPDDDAPGWHHVARIPNYLIEKWLVEDGVNVFDKNNGAWLMAKLDSIEYRFLRINTGQLGIRKKIL